MPLFVLAYGICLFFAALVMHVALWNLFRIRREILWLAVVFIAIPAVIVASSWTIGFLDTTSTIAAGMLYTALAVVYIQTYPALREDVPSIRILMTVYGRSGSMTRREIIDHLARQRLFETKIADLENDALIYVREDRMHLTTMGTVLARVFHSYRKLFGRTAGRG